MNYRITNPTSDNILSATKRLTEPKMAMLQVVKQKERADLKQRSELKFTFEQADLPKLRQILGRQCLRQVHNHPVSVVRSVYFDDWKLSACQANLSGLTDRNKVRIRWYDQLKPGHDFYLEIKWRRNRRTGKHRQRICSQKPLSELSYSQIYNSLLEQLPPAYVRFLLRYDQPVALVEYRREHFVSTDQQLRMTIDYDLAFYDQTGKQKISTVFPKRLANLVVLEGKTGFGSECRLESLLRPIRKRVGRCSKYVKACHAIGLIRES